MIIIRVGPDLTRKLESKNLSTIHNPSAPRNYMYGELHAMV
jgi:hypothetical protein